jgi:MFS family permease
MRQRRLHPVPEGTHDGVLLRLRRPPVLAPSAKPLIARLPFFYGWVLVGVVFVTMGVGINARSAFSLLFPPILAEFGWERGLAAGAFSFGFLVSAVLSPIVGRVLDRHGPLLVVELGVALTGAGLLLATLVEEPWQLYATLGLLVGAGSNLLGYTVQSLFLTSWFVRRRGLATSIAFSGVGVGALAIMPWMQGVIEEAGWRAACWMLGIVSLVLLAPLNLLLRRRPQALGMQPDGDGRGAGATRSSAAANVVDPAWAATEWTLARAAQTARFWWIMTAFTGAMFAWYAVQVHQTKYLIEIGFSATTAAWALGLVPIIAIPGQIALGHLSDRIGREWVWTIGCAGFAICYVALLALRAAPTPALLYLMIIAQGLLGYSLPSVMAATVTEIFEGRHAGAIFGTLMTTSIVGGAVGPWLTGAVHDATGSYAPAFAIALALSALSALALWLAAPRKVRAVAGRVARMR